tara:strand:+ start:84 stop:338 length:255 start_codon:yes stop_codon:yes gene_type:complete
MPSLAYLIIVCIIILFAAITQPFREGFIIKRKRSEHLVQVGVLHNTPAPIKNLMMGLNKLGGQITADSKYDTVADDYLNKDNVK